MASPYPLPLGLHAIPPHLLDLQPDSLIDTTLLRPPPITSQKNIWFFWHTGFPTMHPYTKRNIRAYHRRFSPSGWTIRILDRQPNSASNVANFLDVNDPAVFPEAFTNNSITGAYAAQHTSDLVRWPLLLKYGGVYADVGMLQIGDLDRLWETTVGDPASRFEVLSYAAGGATGRNLTNYFLCSGPENALFARCHRLLLKMWEGKSSTEGMHRSPLLKGVPLMEVDEASFEEDGRTVGSEEISWRLTDYIIQGQVMSLVMGLVDEEDAWDGPRYVKEHVYGIDFMEGSQLINELTAWDGTRQFELMSLELPREGEVESDDQKKAREIVEGCLTRSFGFKLATGFILKVMGDTLSSLWRRHVGSDDVPGTYAHWLRYATMYWNQDELPPTLEFEVTEPFKKGPLLREEWIEERYSSL